MVHIMFPGKFLYLRRSSERMMQEILWNGRVGINFLTRILMIFVAAADPVISLTVMARIQK